MENPYSAAVTAAVAGEVVIEDVIRKRRGIQENMPLFLCMGFSRAMGELYEEARMDHKFDYPTIEKVIDENVPSHWFIFVSWIKGIIRMMAGAG